MRDVSGFFWAVAELELTWGHIPSSPNSEYFPTQPPANAKYQLVLPYGAPASLAFTRPDLMHKRLLTPSSGSSQSLGDPPNPFEAGPAALSRPPSSAGDPPLGRRDLPSFRKRPRSPSDDGADVNAIDEEEGEWEEDNHGEASDQDPNMDLLDLDPELAHSDHHADGYPQDPSGHLGGDTRGDRFSLPTTDLRGASLHDPHQVPVSRPLAGMLPDLLDHLGPDAFGLFAKGLSETQKSSIRHSASRLAYDPLRKLFPPEMPTGLWPPIQHSIQQRLARIGKTNAAADAERLVKSLKEKDEVLRKASAEHLPYLKACFEGTSDLVQSLNTVILAVRPALTVLAQLLPTLREFDAKLEQELEGRDPTEEEITNHYMVSHWSPFTCTTYLTCLTMCSSELF